MSKRVWSIEELMKNDFSKAILKNQLNRDESNLTKGDYVIIDNQGNLHIHNVESQGAIDTDTFKSNNYTNHGKTIDEEEEYKFDEENHSSNKQQYNQNKFIEKVKHYVWQKGNKKVKDELKKYLKHYLRWDDSRIAKFLRRLKLKTNKIYKKFDSFNVAHKLEKNLKDLLLKKLRISKSEVFLNNIGKFMKFNLPNKTFNTLLKSAGIDEELILDLLLAL